MSASSGSLAPANRRQMSRHWESFKWACNSLRVSGPSGIFSTPARSRRMLSPNRVSSPAAASAVSHRSHTPRLVGVKRRQAIEHGEQLRRTLPDLAQQRFQAAEERGP